MRGLHGLDFAKVNHTDPLLKANPSWRHYSQTHPVCPWVSGRQTFNTKAKKEAEVDFVEMYSNTLPPPLNNQAAISNHVCPQKKRAAHVQCAMTPMNSPWPVCEIRSPLINRNDTQLQIWAVLPQVQVSLRQIWGRIKYWKHKTSGSIRK